MSNGTSQIGVLTSFTPSDRPVTRIKTLDVPPEGYDFGSGQQTYTATIKSFWLHPKLRPLPLGQRNPPIHVLRQWWVWHLGRTNRSFKRTRLAAVRRLWRAEAYEEAP